MENEIFTVRCYSKSELAMMYFPELSQEMASQKLKRWLIYDKILFKAC